MQTQLAYKRVPEETTSDMDIRFIVFKDKKYFFKNAFTQPRVLIGSNPKADVFLDHGSVEDVHADVTVEDGIHFLTNYRPNNGLRVNGRSIEKVELRAQDVINIGPFSLVIEHLSAVLENQDDNKGMQSVQRISENRVSAPEEKQNILYRQTPPPQYAVILINEFADDATRDRVAQRLAVVFRKDPSQILPLLRRQRLVLKKEMSIEKALRLQKLIELTGAACVLEPIVDMEVSPPKPEKPVPVSVVENPENSVPSVLVDEDDDDDTAADFSLKEILFTQKAFKAGQIQAPSNDESQLEIVKTVSDRVADVLHLTPGRRYRIQYDSRRFRLGELNTSGKGYVCFPETWQGYWVSNGNKLNLSTFKTPEHLYRKRRRLYRLPLAYGDTVVAGEGAVSYQIRYTRQTPSSHVASQPVTRELTWRHWASSTGFHLMMVLIACIVFAISSRGPEKEDLHFVTIDMSSLTQTPEPTPTVEKKPEPRPQEPIRIEPAKETPEVKKTAQKKPIQKAVPKKTKSVAKSTKKTSPTAHPDAGGGTGDGNVQNRNIKQTGLLSLLGDGTVGSPSSAIAAVTNIDAVAVPEASDTQFAVGGIKGSLGTGKISISTGEIVQTKGSSQVLRSAGAKGPGTVAALERGDTGNKQVKGMVTAKMTKTVSIQGGMSREMVKRIIDQHLSEIQYCYESALMNNPAIMGRIVYEWKILMSGKVGEVRIVSSTVNSHQIHDCIKSSIKSWQFPKPVGSEVVVSYPFVFDLVGF